MKIKKKQVDALEALKSKELNVIQDNKSNDNEKSLIYKEVSDELSNERIREIRNMSKEIYFDKLTYYYKSPYLSPMNFISSKSPMHIYSDTETGNISIEKIEVDQKQFKSKLNKITIGNLNHKSNDQLKIFVSQDIKLINCIMMMPKLYLTICIKQNREQVLKY